MKNKPRILATEKQDLYFKPTFITDYMFYLQSNKGYKFTASEKLYIELLFSGKSAKEIAKLQGISFRTAEHHIHKIKNKMSVKTKLEIISKHLQEFYEALLHNKLHS